MKNFIFFLICSQLIVYSQDLQLFGTVQPGNAMIGKADNILQVMLNDEKLKIDDNGVFIFGFDRDAKGTYLLKVKYKDGKSEIKKFDLPERKYDIQKINSTKNTIINLITSQFSFKSEFITI